MSLPFIDEHAILVDAPLSRTWTSLKALVTSGPRGWLARLGGRILGCRDLSPIVGFHVAEELPEERLVLAGQHRFARYQLVLRVRSLAPHLTELTAETRAEFPGLGRLYRLLVIDCGLHLLVARLSLRLWKWRIEGGKSF